MSTISLTTSTPAQGSLGKVFAKVVHAWLNRASDAAIAGMSEREFQDIGWGQMDRYSQTLMDSETPPERHARLVARAAWFAPLQNAA